MNYVKVRTEEIKDFFNSIRECIEKAYNLTDEFKVKQTLGIAYDIATLALETSVDELECWLNEISNLQKGNNDE